MRHRLCAATAAEARRLRLDPMVTNNDAPLGTAFTISVDVRHGLTTGISAEQRCNTVRALANNNMGGGFRAAGSHLSAHRQGRGRPHAVRPHGGGGRSADWRGCPRGRHLRTGQRRRHGDEGRADRRLRREARTERISVADLIAYRQARENLVERIATFPVHTEWGDCTGHAYSTPFDSVQHVAIVYGRVGDGRNMPVRLHRANAVTDVFEGGKTIAAVMKRFAKEGRGVLVYLRDGTAGVPTTRFSDTEASGSEMVRTTQWREVGLGAQISATSASSRSATSRPRRAPMWASAGSGSK